MNLSDQFRQVTNVKITDVTDPKGNLDPLAGWVVDLQDPQSPIKGFYVDSERNIFIQIKNGSLFPKREIEDRYSIRFKVSGKIEP